MIIPADSLLFHPGDLSWWLDTRRLDAAHQALHTPQETFKKESDQSISTSIINRYRLKPIQWTSQKPDIRQREEQVDVTGDPRRDRLGRGKILVLGMRVTYAYRFAGSAELFQYRPRAFDLNPPRGTVAGEELTISINVPTDAIDVEAIEAHMQTQFSSINRYLETSHQQLQQHLTELQDAVLSAVKSRRESLDKAETAVEELKQRQRG